MWLNLVTLLVLGQSNLPLWLTDLFSSSLSSSLNMLSSPPKTAVRQCIITRQQPFLVPPAVYLHKLIQVTEVIGSAQTVQSKFSRCRLYPRCETLTCHANGQITKLPRLLFFFFLNWFTDLWNVYLLTILVFLLYLPCWISIPHVHEL